MGSLSDPFLDATCEEEDRKLDVLSSFISIMREKSRFTLSKVTIKAVKLKSNEREGSAPQVFSFDFSKKVQVLRVPEHAWSFGFIRNVQIN